MTTLNCAHRQQCHSAMLCCSCQAAPSGTASGTLVPNPHPSEAPNSRDVKGSRSKTRCGHSYNNLQFHNNLHCASCYCKVGSMDVQRQHNQMQACLVGSGCIHATPQTQQAQAPG